MRIAIVREVRAGERRVAATPDTVRELCALGASVAFEPGAGAAAGFADALFVAAGAERSDDAVALLGSADIVLKVLPPTVGGEGARDECALLREGATVIGFVQPDLYPEVLPALTARRVTVLAMERVPRITRAQKMDALSSMANLAGYRAIIEASQVFGSFFCGQITAAGKVPPAKVLVIGAGVAGLSAIGTARGLGAEVRAFDTRPAVREQVESMGASFLTVEIAEDGEGAGGYGKEMSQAFLDAEMALFRAQASEVDIVVTTALIPGRKAPLLWMADAVEAMRPGSVVVDLAASHGGNCALTRAGEHVVHGGVHILGYTDLPCRMAPVASRLYARNVAHLLRDLLGAAAAAEGAIANGAATKGLHLDPLDEVVRGATLLRDGVVPTWPALPTAPAPSPAATPAVAKPNGVTAPAAPLAQQPRTPTSRPSGTRSGGGHGGHGHGAHAGHGEVEASSARPNGVWAASAAVVGLFVLWMALTGGGYEQSTVDTSRQFLQHLTVFVLSCVVGWHVVWNVTPALHTPLMSVTNAISGIIVLGGLLQLGAASHASPALRIVGIAAVALATINVAGGFLVTRRMLAMFRREGS